MTERPPSFDPESTPPWEMCLRHDRIITKMRAEYKRDIAWVKALVGVAMAAGLLNFIGVHVFDPIYLVPFHP